MKRALLAVVWLGLIVGCAPPDPQQLYTEGEEFLSQGLLDEAIAKYKTAIKYQPEFAEAYASLGQAQFLAEDYVAAIETLQRAAELQPEELTHPMLLGVAQLSAGRYEAAETTFQRVLGTHPGYPVAELNLACATALRSGVLTSACYQQIKDGLGSGRAPTDVAMRPVFETVAELCPDFADGRYNLALIYLNNNQSEEAKVLLEQIAEQHPGFALAHRALGLLDSREGELKQAIKHYEAALEADPGLANAHFELGAIYDRQRRKRQAIEHLKRYLELEPQGQWSIKAAELLEKNGVKVEDSAG